MECRIDVEDQSGFHVVRVAGRLTDAQVPDLLRVCAKHTPVQVDLTQLDSATSVGIEALRRVQKAGAQIVGATQFILLQLDASHAGRE